MPKNKQSNLIASVKTPNISFINEYYKLRNKGGGGGGVRGSSLLVTYQSLLTNIFSLAPPIIFFIKYRPNRLLRVNFIE